MTLATDRYSALRLYSNPNNFLIVEVTLPHQQYYLELGEVEPDEVLPVSLDTSSSAVVGLQMGDVQLFLIDKNLKKDTIQDSSDIHVVEPAYISKFALILFFFPCYFKFELFFSLSFYCLNEWYTVS